MKHIVHIWTGRFLIMYNEQRKSLIINYCSLICRDPLNLNSLSDEKVSKVANAVTPEYSPIPTPKHRKADYKIEVLIPNDISDPLNLMQNDNDEEYDASFNKKKFRPRKRTHNHR